MPEKGSGYQEELTAKERAVLEEWIDSRKAANGTTERTQAKQRHIGYVITKRLHERGTTLDKAQGKDFAGVAAALSGKITQNTRQTLISQMKSMVRYIQKTRKIKDADLILTDVKAGSPSKQNKNVLTKAEWHKLLNAPMSARERAFIAMLYDGYHRPYEPYMLKWSDLKKDSAGRVEYKITFKTGIVRTIVQKPETTALLEEWRRQLGYSYNENSFIFPTRDGVQYGTIMQVTKLFRALAKVTGIQDLKPSCIRNTAITHDVQANHPLSYICMRAWGEPFNPMINIYVKANSSAMQIEQHEKLGYLPTSNLNNTPDRNIAPFVHCPKCGRDNFPDATLCSFCGTGLRGESAVEFASNDRVSSVEQENAELKTKLAALENTQKETVVNFEKLAEKLHVEMEKDMQKNIDKIMSKYSKGFSVEEVLSG